MYSPSDRKMNTSARILLAEDDFRYGKVIKKHLEEAGYLVVHCFDGEVAWKRFQRDPFDICLLDIIMPKKDGFTLAQDIRKKNGLVPIMFFSSTKVEHEDKVYGFKLGADEYMIKPFSIKELLMRIRVFLRRTMAHTLNPCTTHVVGRLKFDYEKLLVYDQQSKVIGKMTPRESTLLRFLVNNPNKILKREDILLKLWGKEDFFTGRSMDVFMTKLRKHFKGEPRIGLETLHNVGLRLNIPMEILPYSEDEQPGAG